MTDPNASLDMPDDAVQAFLAVDDDWSSDDEIAQAMHPIVVPVVVADLRTLAVHIGPQQGVVDGSDDMTRRECAAALLARADQWERLLSGGAR